MMLNLGTRCKVQGARCKEGAFTLIELLIATTLGVVVILAIGQIDMTRIFLSREVATGGEVALAMTHIGKQLEGADRIFLRSTGPGADVQIRVPIGTVFDAAGNYRWFQYQHTGTAIQVNDGGCNAIQTFRNIDHFRIQFVNMAPAPPGGAGSEPFAGEDNNLVRIEMATLDPATNPSVPVYVSEITIRAGAYTDVNAVNPTDSGSGLAPFGISNQPC